LKIPVGSNKKTKTKKKWEGKKNEKAKNRGRLEEGIKRKEEINKKKAEVQRKKKQEGAIKKK